jgi:hypothetical protein
MVLSHGSTFGSRSQISEATTTHITRTHGRPVCCSKFELVTLAQLDLPSDYLDEFKSIVTRAPICGVDTIGMQRGLDVCGK